ncbi:hypothetical protein C8R42DRAFT_322608 [Lentinula raphanica]|nr:hypothetical protein C8R42DRAFT_322608 [Lentinula raphanica]
MLAHVSRSFTFQPISLVVAFVAHPLSLGFLQGNFGKVVRVLLGLPPHLAASDLLHLSSILPHPPSPPPLQPESVFSLHMFKCEMLGRCYDLSKHVTIGISASVTRCNTLDPHGQTRGDHSVEHSLQGTGWHRLYWQQGYFLKFQSNKRNNLKVHATYASGTYTRDSVTTTYRKLKPPEAGRKVTICSLLFHGTAPKTRTDIAIDCIIWKERKTHAGGTKRSKFCGLHRVLYDPSKFFSRESHRFRRM